MRAPSQRPRTRRAAAALTAVVAVVGLAGATGTAAAQVDGLRPDLERLLEGAASSDRDDPRALELGQRLAAADTAGAVSSIEENGFADDPFALGYALGRADAAVLEAGADDETVRQFAETVDEAYRTAGVTPPVAGLSFAVGLGDVFVDYAAEPSDPLTWGTAQANIGASILLRAVPGWVEDAVAAIGDEVGGDPDGSAADGQRDSTETTEPTAGADRDGGSVGAETGSGGVAGGSRGPAPGQDDAGVSPGQLPATGNGSVAALGLSLFGAGFLLWVRDTWAA